MTQRPLYLNSYPKRAGSKFDVLATIDGWDVIASDSGRPVAHHETKREAKATCETLNHASRGGVRTLARALGASNPSDARASGRR